MKDETLRQFLNFFQVNRPDWKYIIEGDIIRVCTASFVIDWTIIRQVEDIKKFQIQDIIYSATMGLMINFKVILD